MNLNFPYFWYPKMPFSGYMDVDNYNSNLIKLQNSLIELQHINEPILFHITIGAAMEEIMKKYNNYTNTHHWMQLFPHHIINAYKNNIKVIHFIICPNSDFRDHTNAPIFISKTMKIHNWTFDNTTECYKSDDGLIIVKIFYTMMPTVDKRNETILREYESKFSHIKKYYDNTNVPTMYIPNTYKQTQYDISFTLNFYNELKKTIINVKNQSGFTTCFSFAVFNTETANYSAVSSYGMFAEIVSTFVNNDILYENSCLLAEWTYNYKNYCVLEFINNIKMSYVDDDMLITIENEKIVCKILNSTKVKTILCYLICSCEKKIYLDIQKISGMFQQLFELFDHTSQIDCSNVSEYLNKHNCVPTLKKFNSTVVNTYIFKLNWIKSICNKSNLTRHKILQIYFLIKEKTQTSVHLIKEYDLPTNVLKFDLVEMIAFSQDIKRNIIIPFGNSCVSVGANADTYNNLYFDSCDYEIF